MPSVFVDRLPLPSLQTYTTISVLLLSCSIYYAVQVTTQPGWNVTEPEFWNGADTDSENGTDYLEQAKLLQMMLMNHAVTRKIYEVMYVMVQEQLCMWTLINMAFCSLILVWKCIQRIVFGDLRVVEQQHIKDKFWNFVFYKFIFIFGVMNVQYMDEVVLWSSWFSIVGFFHLLSQLCKDRFEYLSFSPMTPKWTHLRLFALIFTILGTTTGLCIVVGIYASLNTFFFMSAECMLVTLRTLYVLIRYILHLWDSSHEGIWEHRGIYTYYCELVFELASLMVDFFHHLHMLLWGNIFLSMASLVICMQLRFLFHEIQHKLTRHRTYLKVAHYIETNYPLATQDEIDTNSDDCAICWEHMESARKLPCGHMFHISCLRSWLEQVSTCPTCRTPLIDKGSRHADATNRNNLIGQEDAQPRQPNTTTSFHFDGSRYVSWFPSFSVEVSHTGLRGSSQLDSMAQQVVQLFPHMPFPLVVDDLRFTHSVEITVENILEERLVPPPNASLQSFFPAPTETRRHEPSQRETDSLRNASEHMENSVNKESCRFSKSSQEREQMLTLRKEELIKRARNKYVSKINVGHNEGSSSMFS